MLLNACATPSSQPSPVPVNTGAFDTDYAQMVTQDSQGQIEVYPFDNGRQADSYMPALDNVTTSGTSLSTDPSVEIYTFDDADSIMPGPDLAQVGREIIATVEGVSNDGMMFADGLIVYFGDGQTSLDQADRRALRDYAQRYKDSGLGQIVVEGHASAMGKKGKSTEIANIKFSLERAYHVTKRLIEEGIPAAQIITKGYGANIPALPQDGMSEADASRRVEIHAIP
ncbi:MAG: OmpA family protein [Alphaproteobacteria bacterium]|nr:OmpA family protein [Alphaproteobacteria bacterium]